MIQIKILIFLMLLLGLSGCITYKLPPVLSPEQNALLSESPYKEMILGVQVHKESDKFVYYPYELEKFADLVRKTGLFKEVKLVTKGESSANLNIRLNSVSIIPMCATGEASLMVMTVGLIPLVTPNQTYSFEIINPNKDSGLKLDFTYIQKSYFGSWVSLLNLSSGWSSTPKEQRNVDLLKYYLVSRKDEVLRMADGYNQ